LNAYGARLESTFCQPTFLQRFRPVCLELPMLDAYVRCYTGKPHYAELCYLLDAADYYEREILSKGTEWNPDSLKTRLNRFKKNHPQEARNIKRLIAEYKEQ